MNHSDSIATISAAPFLNAGEFWWSPLGFSRYLVSDEGTVASVVKKKPRVLKPIFFGAYHGVTLVDDSGEHHRRYIHRLVLEGFAGPCPEGMEARHLDGNRFNNRLNNLAWGTRSENARDRERHGNGISGEANPCAKLTRTQVEEMREIRATTRLSHAKIAAMYGVSTMTAYRAVEGVSWN